MAEGRYMVVCKGCDGDEEGYIIDMTLGHIPSDLAMHKQYGPYCRDTAEVVLSMGPDYVSVPFFEGIGELEYEDLF